MKHISGKTGRVSTSKFFTYLIFFVFAFSFWTQKISANCTQSSFISLPDITDVRSPDGMALGDFNRDGKLDLVTSATGLASGNISVRFGNNDGSFQAPTYYAAGSVPSAIAIGDFDGINGLDIAVATGSTASSNRVRIAILLNLGNGTFTPVTSTQCANNEPFCPGGADQIENIAVGRIDDNNTLDLVVSDLNSQLVRIYFGFGNGTFASPVVETFTSGSGGAIFVTLADMDTDGDQDLVAVFSSNGSGEVQIKNNNGNGTFQAVQANNIIPVGDAPKSITIADFDRIRGPDFATADDFDNSISVKLRNAAGGFSNASGSPYSIAPFNPKSITAADFNIDGRLDLATANSSSGGFSVLLGNADGSFGMPVTSTTVNTPSLIFAEDVTGDFRADIILANGTDANPGVGVKKNTCASLPFVKRRYDYDGDNKTDISIFRPAPGEWWYQKSSNGGNFAAQFGSSTDKITPADFTGDGRTDFAFFRPSSGQWFILRSEDFSFYAFPFGTGTDTSVPADYDGDGSADAAVFRPSTNTWFIQKSSGGTDIIGFGANGDKPVPADYDGDGKADIAIFRPSGASGAEWWIRRSSNATVFAATFGTSTDKPTQGDFTGDGKADIAFFRPSNGSWFVLRSEDFSFFSFPFGASGDVPVAGDYDGDGRFDAGVFRPSNNTWFVQRSTAGTLIQTFGTNGDLPTPNAFVP